MSIEKEPEAIVVDFPLRGEWTAYHTPAEKVPSHGTHLHFQLMDRPDLLDAVGLPCAFRDYEAWRDGAWSRVTAGMPKKREFVRHA